MRSKLMTAIGTTALIGLSTMFMTACNDKDSVPAASSTAPAASSAAGQNPKSGSQATVRAVGKTGWYEGFEITVDKATIVPSESGGGKLVVDITYKNLTTENKTLTANNYLQFGTAADTSAGFDNPTVPGKGSATGTVTTSLKQVNDPERLLDQFTVVYGQASDNQTKIPVKAGAAVETVQPKTLNITGKLVQDQTTVEITGATLTPSYTKNERGKYELALHVKFIGGSGISAGGTNIFYEYFSVQTPDGQHVVADIRGPINELLDRNETIDNSKDFAVFLVPAPGTGQFTLTYDAKKGEGQAPTLPFTVG
ncbi:hypothetical protein [Nocardia sp. NPDC052566]|uniref:hypothetical protein n=1 Tax=Nocardia sp. NPDC052566 TaxID=3364330 RepID=UPI0037CC37CD